MLTVKKPLRICSKSPLKNKYCEIAGHCLLVANYANSQVNNHHNDIQELKEPVTELEESLVIDEGGQPKDDEDGGALAFLKDKFSFFD